MGGTHGYLGLWSRLHQALLYHQLGLEGRAEACSHGRKVSPQYPLLVVLTSSNSLFKSDHGLGIEKRCPQVGREVLRASNVES